MSVNGRAAKKIAHEFEFDRHCWLLELIPAGSSPFYTHSELAVAHAPLRVYIRDILFLVGVGAACDCVSIETAGVERDELLIDAVRSYPTDRLAGQPLPHFHVARETRSAPATTFGVPEFNI